MWQHYAQNFSPFGVRYSHLVLSDSRYLFDTMIYEPNFSTFHTLCIWLFYPLIILHSISLPSISILSFSPSSLYVYSNFLLALSFRCHSYFVYSIFQLASLCEFYISSSICLIYFCLIYLFTNFLLYSSILFVSSNSQSFYLSLFYLQQILCLLLVAIIKLIFSLFLYYLSQCAQIAIFLLNIQPFTTN